MPAPPIYCVRHVVAYLGDAVFARDLNSVAHVCSAWHELLSEHWEALCRRSYGADDDFFFAALQAKPGPSTSSPDGEDPGEAEAEGAGDSRPVPPVDWHRLFLRSAVTLRRVRVSLWTGRAAARTHAAGTRGEEQEQAGLAAQNLGLTARADESLEGLKAAVARRIGRDAAEFELARHAGVSHTMELARPVHAALGGGFSLASRHGSVERWQVLSGSGAIRSVLDDGAEVHVFLWERAAEPGFPSAFVPLVVTEGLSVEQLRADGDWWRLLESAIPEEEREEPEDLVKMIQETGQAYRAVLGRRTVGLGVVHLLKSLPCGYLLYLAVSSDYRSLSIGSKLLSFIFDDVARRYQSSKGPHDPQPQLGAGVVWEVDAPEAALGGPDGTGTVAAAAVQVKRVRFYQRLGAFLHSGRYHQPPLRGGEALPMAIMFWPAAGTAEEGLPDAAQLSRVVKAVYEENYQVFNAVPPAVLRALFDQYCGDVRAGKWYGLEDGVPAALDVAEG